MATVTRPESSGPPVAVGIVFRDVSWDDYEAMLRIVGERPIRVQSRNSMPSL